MARPSEYDEKYCEMLIAHMSSGLSFEAFAGVIGKSKQTLYTWAEKKKAFMDAKKRGFALCQLWWERAGIMAMTGKKQTMPDGTVIDGSKFNATIWIFNMKNRFCWSDRSVVTTEDEEGDKKPINGFMFVKADG